ncbi:MAG TPA: LamG domain-containing protein [Bryobacteraceae bacterium]|nr:LamG domain-containing protein [Bryobacteraceae bacterium]
MHTSRVAAVVLCLGGIVATAQSVFGGTTALWLFDESKSVYPSTILNDATDHGYFAALGRGAHLVDGKFGRALEPIDPPPFTYTFTPPKNAEETASAILFGLLPAPIAKGRTVPPMNWKTATFAALFTSGETHLRKPEFANATDSRLNLGAFDWTIEFWYKSAHASTEDGVIFEIGQGPRGETNHVTRLSLNRDGRGFTLSNQPSATRLVIASNAAALQPGNAHWHHFAFVYSARDQQLRHYVDGVLQPLPARAALQALPHGDEAYFSIGRDGLWTHPLPGAIDELRFSDNQVYTGPFTPPGSFSILYGKGLPRITLKKGPPLLFGSTAAHTAAIPLGSRKHLFLDDALIAERHDITFVPNPPRRTEKVWDNIRGHMSLVEDEHGLLRIYYQGPGDALAVITSKDGVHWEKPDLGREYKGERNIVLAKPVGLGTVFLDPNAPPESRWKYLSGVRREAVFVFSSPDGWQFHPFETAALPFSAGSQSAIYYDDQRQLYIAFHRSDNGETPAGETSRRFVRSETKSLLGPWDFQPVTPKRALEIAKTTRTKADQLNPWYLDNGPLAPSGFDSEFPVAIGHRDNLDPPGTDVYVTDAVKYPWAPDAYLAFPSVYFHYEGDGPAARQTLGTRERKRGSGVVEVQLSVSRDGITWNRYPRPVYAGIDSGGANAVHEAFMVAGIVRRGNEIWQYLTGHPGNGIGYHSAWVKGSPSPLYRLVQRLDGFVALEAPYSGGTFTTKPLTFEGARLRLNINTEATGYAQVGIETADGKPIPGYSLDDSVYINGDFIDTPVEWLHHGSDVSSLEGRPVRLVFRMRGARLFAMQFTKE